MSRKVGDDDDDDVYYDEDEEDEEDEGEFELDDDEDDEELVVDDEEDDEESPFLQGDLYWSGDSIVYETSKPPIPGATPFRLACTPKDGPWSLSSPIMEPTTFVGWIKDPSNKVQFKLSISKTDPTMAIDSMEQVFLDAQAEKLAATSTAASQEAEAADGKMPAKPKATADDDDENDGEENAKMPAGKMPAMKKAPPSEKPSAATMVYALDGVEVKEGDSSSRTLHGLFRVPPSVPEKRIFVMTTLQEPSTTAAAAGAAMPARKRTRATRSLDDDEEDDDGDEGVGYNELIDLHDDAGLSTEELRRKYYGGGGGDSPEPAAKKPKAAQDEEDDDDDAYGF